MIKKMLSTLIGVALAGGVSVAAADVAVFGHIDTSLDAIDVDGGNDDITMNCTTCSVGFKGSEDLGNGLKAIFSLDFQYDTTERRNSSLTDRDQWLGMSGGFGKVRAGTISTGYKSHGAMIDPLYRTALQGRDHGLQSELHSGAGEELEGRATNTIRWDSVDYSGVKLVAHYTFDNTENDGEGDNPYGIGASYENGGLLAFADYMNNSQSGAGEKDAWKIGGKYDMGLFSFMGQYEDYSNSSSDKEKVWHVAAGVNNLLGMNLYLGIGKGEDDTSKDEYTAWTLAVSHDFSKSTMVYAGHTQIDCDTGGASATLAACDGIAAGGGEIDHTSFGIKHKF